MKNKLVLNKKGSGIFYKYGFMKVFIVLFFCDYCGLVIYFVGLMYVGWIYDFEFV